MNLLIEEIGKFIYAFYILSIFSFYLYKETPLYRFAEASAVAVALSNFVVMNVWYLYNSTWTPMIKGEYINIIPLILGLSIFLRLFSRTEWVGRPAMGLLVGCVAGLAIRTIIEARFLKQIELVIKPILGGTTTPIDNFLLVVLPLLIIPYFIFSREHTGTLGYISKIGRYAMMIAFGALFGTGVTSRMSWLATQWLDVLRIFRLVPG